MADPGFFKTTTFGGFDKKSVLTYIDSLNEGFHATELQYQEKIAGFEKAQESQLAHIHKLEAQLAEQNAKLETLAGRLENDRDLSKQAQEMIARQDAQIKGLQKQHDDDQRELQIQIERSRQLQFKAESLDYKSKKYDEMSTQIGDALIEAKRNADSIVSAAHDQAQEIVSHTQARMRSFYSELGSFKGDSARLRKSIEEILFVLNDRIDVMQEVVAQVEKRFQAEGIKLDYTEDGREPFCNPDDQAGFLGGAQDADLQD